MKCPEVMVLKILSMETLEGMVQLIMLNCLLSRWGMSFLPGDVVFMVCVKWLSCGFCVLFVWLCDS